MTQRRLAELVGGDIELLGQNLAVACRLVQHINEVRVFKDVLNLGGGQQVLHILGDPGGDAAPFAEPLPNLHRVCRRLFVPAPAEAASRA